MQNSLEYAHGLDWDEHQEPNTFHWEQKDIEEPDDYFNEEDDDLDDEE